MNDFAETAGKAGPESERLALEWARLRADRQRAALELRLKRRELTAKASTPWKELLTNPLIISIVGATVTLIVTIVATRLNTSQSLEVEATKARHALQGDLIKKFVEAPSTDTVRTNLEFLVEANLVPDYADGISAWLKKNPSAPRLGVQTGVPKAEPSPVPLINSTIATLAWSRLSAPARMKVAELLNGENLADAANWLNQQVSLPQHASLRRLRFVSVPRDAASIDMDRDCKDGQCAIGGIERFRQVLRTSAATKETRAEALRILVGLVADIHRPLHISYPDDLGGNRLRVTVRSVSRQPLDQPSCLLGRHAGDP